VIKRSIREKDIEVETLADKFPIVGIGSSAGGLEAMEQFFEKVPLKSGLAFVVIQHLDPTVKGMLPELLQRISHMEVFQAKDRMPIKPDCVYVIPPNKSMSVLNGKLHLFDPVEARGLRLPIDYFFRSLADDCNELSVGVILSGMGSDGCIGIRAIKEKGGIVMVQDPDTAKFDSMPHSAIDSVTVDIIAPPGDLPGKLVDFLKHIPTVQSDIEVAIKDKSALEKIIILLRAHTGNDFSMYKKNTLYRRIERRMGVHRIQKIFSYVHFLQENPGELDILFKELLIGVTNFFRDTEVWDKLKLSVIPDIIARHSDSTIIRAWVPGCSTGEEAYSLAILFKEELEKTNPMKSLSLQIFASDIDDESIETARKGVFPENIASDVSGNRLSRFFTKIEEGYRINTEIRETIVFAQHNIIMHPPFTKIDILSCRNLLIYIDPELQKKLLALFYYTLNPSGVLLLGGSESLGTQSHLFVPVESKLKIYKKSVTIDEPELYDFPSSFARTKSDKTEIVMNIKPTQNIQTLADQLLLKNFSPVGVLVNENGDIIYISGRTGKYLEPAVGKANLNILAMLRDGLRNEFPSAFQKAILKKEPVVLDHLRVGVNGGSKPVKVTIQWVDKPSALKGSVMVVFSDLPETTGVKSRSVRGKQAKGSTRETELEEELQRIRDENQNILEEMQTSQEELKSTNEELQSTNEELQSTNEELTTSKEEMQSLNEELQTVNAELQSKVDEFLRVNNDMKNLLNSTDIATLFLDKELNIRRYTNQATKIFKLIKSDVGRPFTDQVSDLLYPELADDAIEVLRTLVFIQKQVAAKDGRWFSIRIMPYRTFDDRIDGLVITFINISNLKNVEEKFYDTQQLFQLLVNSSSDIFLQLNNKWEILEFNPAAEKSFGRTKKEVIDQNFFGLFVPEKSRKSSLNELNNVCKTGKGILNLPVIVTGNNLIEVEWQVTALNRNNGSALEIVLIADSI
jgi:two-component system, chemotaxis family, CheB/CheR fusion protein